MLESIKAKNFQSHEDTELILSQSVNAITGVSDVGKSSITRLIQWVVTNRPTGTAFQSYWADKEGTKGELNFDGTVVSRTRSKTKNSYKLGKTEFDTVKTDIPQEVQDFINLSDVNIQGQHDHYFLLQDSSGEVAKKLNKITNLEIIDFVLKEITSDITENNGNIVTIESAINDLTEKLKGYEHLDKVEHLLNDISKLLQQQEEAEITTEKLIITIDGIKDTKEELEMLGEWLKIETEVSPIIEMVQRVEDINYEYQELSEIVKSITDLNKLIQTLSDQVGYEEKVDNILGYIEECNRFVDDLRALSKLLLTININIDAVEEFEGRILKLTDEAVGLIKENEMCPLCGGKVGEDALEHIRSWL